MSAPRLRAVGVAAGVLAATGALALACKRDPPPPAPKPAPADHLAPGEVVEGTEEALGLKLPRASTVTRRFRAMVNVTSPLEVDKLTAYVRARVKDGKVSKTATGGTRFENVTPVSAPDRRLTIEVGPSAPSDRARSLMTLRDTTPAPDDPKLTEEQRWNKAGLTPDGRILDPKHLD